MHVRAILLLTLLLALTATAGCIGEDPGNATTPIGDETTDRADQAEASTRSLPVYLPLVRLDNPPEATELDVVCTFGGGPELPRTNEGYVAGGTTDLHVMLANPATSAGYLQVGYALDVDGDHETDAEEPITWLDPVAPGETANRTIEVTGDRIETSPGDDRWSFYKRYTTPEAQEEACYTGAKVGPDSIHIDAVRGGS